ncbi:MAG: hypothetical protein JWR80_3327 [Bradyrhizobium sp.]|nr:hypothetical protein [Bradyrhizobium sp.]
MGWVECESFGFGCPDFADVFEGREVFEGLETAPIIVGVDEVVEMGLELPMAIVMVAFDGGLLDRAVHPLDLAVSPWMPDFGEPMLDAVLVAAHVEHVRHVPRCGTIGVARREGELDAVIGQDGVNLVRHRSDQGDQEGGGGRPASLGTSWTKANLLVRSIAT